ncbi:hypothetical protein QMA77_23885 [Pantoea ananatis]|uniref:hypothetical protein n=1 Tax=Pantoea ananas TaxID=553 RepID=UPI001FF08139|nr:hypothetical protein [Pantoea ananatis]MDI6539959.1 hypothetical protein [Pantoea ananatis]
MDVTNDVIFNTVYRKFKRRNSSCEDIDVLISVLDGEVGSGNYGVNPATVDAEEDINGFCVSYLNYRFFLPTIATLKPRYNGITCLGDSFNEAEIILPTYIQRMMLDKLSQSIIRAPSHEEKIIAGDRALTAMFPPQSLAVLCTELYSLFPVLEECLIQIRETVEAYCLGLYRSAISTLLPCIEHAIRGLGVRLGVNNPNEVGTAHLLSIYDEWLRYYIDKFVYRDYDWVHETARSKKFFATFDDRFQIVLNARQYVQNHLYQNSQKDNGLSMLNRHSILHGFMPKYHTMGNYLRLINLLNNLCFMMTFTGVHASLFFPQSTVRSMAFTVNLLTLEHAGLTRAKLLDSNAIGR